MTCSDLLTSSINANCPTTPKGFEPVGYLYNRSEIDFVNSAYDVTTGKITEFLMKSTAKGYPVTIRGLQPYKEVKVTGEMKPYGIMFNAEASITVLGNTPATSVVVNILTKGEFVLVLVQKGVQDESKYFCLGWESGLIADSATLEPYGDNGGYIVPMKETMRQAPALFVWKTNLATTDALIASTLD